MVRKDLPRNRGLRPVKTSPDKTRFILSERAFPATGEGAKVLGIIRLIKPYAQLPCMFVQYNDAMAELGLELLRLSVRLRPGEDVRVNGFWGSHIRSVLGLALRDCCCPFPDAECELCLLRFDCPFATALHSFRPAERNQIAGVRQRTPHPFIIRPAPGTPETVPAGKEIDFELILLGAATGRIAHWTLAIRRMCEFGFRAGGKPASLLQITQMCKQCEVRLWEPGWESIEPVVLDWIHPPGGLNDGGKQ